MSKTVIYPIPCPKCKITSKHEIFHTINTSMTENAVNRILNDDINFISCANCGNRFQVKTSLFFVNYLKQYCFHYNPKNDTEKNEVLSNVKKKFGEKFFLSNPITFVNWGTFKNEISKLEDKIVSSKTQQTVIEMYESYLRKRNKVRYNSRSWSCNICDGDETTGCLFYDPTECPKFT